jgi:hypothetical protein
VLDGGRMGYGGGSDGYDYHPNKRGSLPKNALLSHCEECVRVGSRSVKGTPVKDNRGTPHTAFMGGVPLRDDVWEGFGATESVPSFRCLAGCICGARSPWPDDRPLPRCPCGETWRWLCAVAEVNAQSGASVSSDALIRNNGTMGYGGGKPFVSHGFSDQGGASRFFNTFSYLAKCSPSERHAGCENLFWKANRENPFGFDQVTKEEWDRLVETKSDKDLYEGQSKQTKARGNVHPTVKSYRLMHWLHSLTGAKRILDFTAGSGTGMYTAFLDGIDWLGAEICPEAITIAEARLAFWKGLTPQAREAFMRADFVTMPLEQNERQRSLFE